MGHSAGLVLVATHVWFIRFCIPPKNLGVPGSSRGTLEHNRADLTLGTLEHNRADLTMLRKVDYLDILVITFG